MEDKNSHIPHIQYHGHWCPGSLRRQGIQNHDIYYVEPEQFGPRNWRLRFGAINTFNHCIFILIANLYDAYCPILTQYNALRIIHEYKPLRLEYKN